MAAARRALLVCLALLLGGCAIVDFEQRRWILQPGARSWGPGEAAARGMDDVWVELRPAGAAPGAAPLHLHGLWLEHLQPQAPVVLFLHGVRWDVRAGAPRMRALHRLGFAVVAVDYRGWGRSPRLLPSEETMAEDARAAWQWLAQQHPQRRRLIYGHSLGAAVATRLAQDVDDEAGLILEGGFPSIPDVWSSLSWGWIPLRPLITQRFDAGSRIAQVGSPVLVLHGSADGMIPPRLGRQLHDRARPPRRWVLVDGAPHDDTQVLESPEVAQAVREWWGVGVP